MQRNPLPRRWFALLASLLAMLAVVTTARAANVAAGKPAFATTNYANAVNVTDNNLGTAWDTTGSPGPTAEFIVVDLGASTSVRTVKVYWSGGAPTSFTVDTTPTLTTDQNDPNYLLDGVWNTIGTFTGTTGQPAPNPTVLSVSGTGRYIRIQPTEAAGNWGVAEFQVYDVTLPALSGTVTAGGSAVPNLAVTLVGPTTGTSTTQVAYTDTSGKYTFAGLDAGTYTLSSYVPGKYAVNTQTVTVGTTNVTQNISFTTPAFNTTAPLPAYTRDVLAASGKTDANGTTTIAFPAEQWPGPANGGVWDPTTTPPSGLTIPDNMPKTLKFALGPSADNQNNAINADGAVIPFSPAHYTNIYILQAATDGWWETTATLHYADGSSQVVTTTSGNSTYHFARGDNTSPAGEDEVVAFQSTGSVDISQAGAANAANFNVFMRTINVDSSKVLVSLSFNGQTGNENTLSKGFIFGWSADSLDNPPAYGKVSGTVKSPTGAPVSNAVVQFYNYRVLATNGTYTFNSIPEGTFNFTASKTASYAPLTKPVTLTAGQTATLDIQFTSGINVVATGLGSPSVDLVSSDANIADFFATGWMPGREYYPTGLYSPDANDGDPNGKYVVNAGAPGGLVFNFVDYGDSPVAPGQPGYPIGGTPNVQLLSGGVFLAPPAKIVNAYFAIVGAEGGTRTSATLTYTDGSTETKVFSDSDWFGDPTSDELPYLIMKGRHSTTGEANAGANIKLNVLPVAVNPNKQLKQIDWWRAEQPQVYPLVFAVAWETDPTTPVPAPVDVTVQTTAGAIVTLGPYNIRADSTGKALFRGLPVGLSLGLGAYVPGSTKQARNDTFVVPNTSSTVTLNIPSGAPNFVPLNLYHDYDAIAMLDMPGDFKTGQDNDSAFIGENLPASGSTVTVNGIPFIMPMKETLFNNTLKINGQTIPVVPGHYSSFDMVITGFSIGGDHTEVFPVKLHYQDGTTEQVTAGVQDWVQDWPNPDNSNLRLFWRMMNPGASNPFYSAGRRNQDADDALNIAFVPEMVPVNAGKVLTSVEFLPARGQLQGGNAYQDAHILTATLEANDTISGGTITGKVVGQPLGASASGALGGLTQPVQVVLDAGHAAYTDASGNFTIANAPLGAGKLTVIPYGTGILTKTFPVNVTASTNAGTLDVGKSVNQISIVLGGSNSESGLQLLTGNQSPYGLTLPFSATTAGSIAGLSERTAVTASGTNDMYFRVDPGWEWRGKIGNAGLDIASLSSGTPKIAPHVYMQVQYYDQGTNTVNLHYNKMETAVHTTGVTTIRLTNPRAAFSKPITKTGSNSWKTTVLDFDPATDAFGAYKGTHLEGDFRFRADPTAAGFQPLALHSIVLSLSSTPVTPITAPDILAVVGGLAAAPTDPTAFAALDVNNDKVIDLRDVVALQRKNAGL